MARGNLASGAASGLGRGTARTVTVGITVVIAAMCIGPVAAGASVQLKGIHPVISATPTPTSNNPDGGGQPWG